ncbi:MAG: mandelate racemase/muconate lactonizing enzyme family protein [Pseudomonadota bacterium]
MTRLDKNDLEITRVRVYVVAPDVTPPYRFTGTEDHYTMHHHVVRLTTRGGIEGASGADSGDPVDGKHAYAEAFRPIVGDVLGRSLLERDAVTAALLAKRSAPVPDPESLLDIAMWDAFGRAAGMPLFRLLGGQRERIPAYASSPVYETVEEYLDYCRLVQGLGFPAVKFHTQCDPTFDLEMTAAVSKAFDSSGLRFMVDLEQRYDFDDAVTLGRALTNMPCDWLEAPLTDTDLDGYAELRRAVGVDVLAAGNTIVELSDMAEAIERGAWSRLRCDPTNVGGIQVTMKVMALAEANGMKTELQSYGYPLSQAANLHVMLGVAGCTYFEQPVPVEHYEYACANPIRIEADGCVSAPEGPGLGLDVDWDLIEAEASLVIDTD